MIKLFLFVYVAIWAVLMYAAGGIQWGTYDAGVLVMAWFIFSCMALTYPNQP